MFTRKTYMQQKLQHLQGDEDIPKDVLQKVKYELDAHNAPCSRKNIWLALKKLNLLQYVEKIPSIINKLNIDMELEKTTLDAEQECPVCFERMKTFVKLECKHLFCETCISKIKRDGTMKCPLCRNIQNVFVKYSLSDEDQKIILDEFNKTMEQYRSGSKNMIPFDQIIRIIANKNGIRIDS